MTNSAIATRTFTEARSFLSAAMTLLIPIECAGCTTPDTQLCDSCSSKLQHDVFARSEQQRPVEAEFPVFAATAYEGVARACILQFKENQRTDLRRPLGELLSVAVSAARRDYAEAARQEGVTPRELWCVPVASTKRAAGKRGYQHVELLLRSLPRERQCERERDRVAVNRWLEASSRRADQVGLTVEERSRNSSHAFTIRKRAMRASKMPLLGKHVLLIDDIATTGATLRAASNALEAAGARVVAAAVIAHTVKWSQ